AVALSAGFNFSEEFYGKSGDAQYIQGGVDIPLPASLGLSAHVGHQTVDKNSTYGVDDYTDWSVGGSATVGGLDLSVTYVDTDLDVSGATSTVVGKEEAVIFGMSKSF
ncbi:MAG: TorF family putative porin, partial [Nitrospinaceae bacterium]|nr:TorF family putative porin [Nitrospinaceae bacterium]